jgi:hypothetical protein
MTLSLKVFLAVGACFVLVSALTVGTAATAVYRAGTIDVQVQDGGTDVSVRVPAALANLAIAFAPTAVIPQEALDEIPDEIEQFRPLLEQFGDSLIDAPDFVIVEVAQRGEYVRVEKREGRILVLVESADGRVHVSVPVKTLHRALGKADRVLRRV